MRVGLSINFYKHVDETYTAKDKPMSSNDYHIAQQGLNTGTYENQVELEMAERRKETARDIKRRSDEKFRQSVSARQQKKQTGNAKKSSSVFWIVLSIGALLLIFGQAGS